MYKLTVSNKISLSSKGKLNPRFEMLAFKEMKLTSVVPKGKFKKGEVVYFAKYGMVLPNHDDFDNIYRPNGDSSKSKLAKDGSIKIVKFNFDYKKRNFCYSYGIVFKKELIDKILFNNDWRRPEFIPTMLDIKDGKILSKNVLIPFIREHDYHLFKNNGFPKKLILYPKYDGDEIIINVDSTYPHNEKNDPNSKVFVNYEEIPTKVLKHTKTRDYNLWEKIQMLFGKKIDNKVYAYVDNNFEPKLSKIWRLFYRLNKHARDFDLIYTVQGVRYKNVFYIENVIKSHGLGFDIYSENTMNGFAETLEVKRPPILTTRNFRSSAEVLKYCDDLFHSEKGKDLKGVVVRDPSLSNDDLFTKIIINPVYDSQR